jgi:putative oxidoreductase
VTSNAIALVGRVLLAAIFVLSGVGKIFAAEATQGYIAHVGLPFPQLALLGAVVLEIGGGLLLATGYKTRLAAIILAAYSVATALIFHNAIGDQNQLIHLLKNFAIAGGLLQVVAFGAGSLGLDARPLSAALRLKKGTP